MGLFLKDKEQIEQEKRDYGNKVQKLKEIKAQIEKGNVTYSVSEVDKLIRHFENLGIFLFILAFNVLCVLGTLLWGFSLITIFNVVIVFVFAIDMGLKTSKANDLIILYKNGNLPTSQNTSSTFKHNSSKADELKKLNELKNEGVLSDEEFENEKKKLLAS